MTYIPLEPVQSSMISQVGYDRSSQTLRVLFHNGDAYDYPMFAERDWDAFREAESVGKHFHRAIKPVFAPARVTEKQLRKPCCDHPDRDTCDDSCLPCDPTCCSGQSSALRRRQRLALAGGLQHGEQLIERARQGLATPRRVDDGGEEDEPDVGEPEQVSEEDAKTRNDDTEEEGTDGTEN